MKRGIHAYISGRVQGVNYRHATLHHAHKYGISGWVQNLPDGRVEVTAFAEDEALTKFIQWLHHGPVLAHVKDIQLEDIPFELVQEFEIRR